MGGGSVPPHDALMWRPAAEAVIDMLSREDNELLTRVGPRTSMGNLNRGAALFFGRNEQGGLRCIYHGWKFDTGGRCLEMPNVPAASDYKDKVRATAYRCRPGLKTKVDVRQMVTNELVDEFNRFDAEAVRKQAREYRR